MIIWKRSQTTDRIESYPRNHYFYSSNGGKIQKLMFALRIGNIWKRDSPFYQVLNVMPCSRKTFLAVSLSSLFALEEVNKYLQGINSDANYKVPCYVNVPQGTRLPVIDEVSTFKFLSQQKRTAAGPDGLSHWFWRDFAEELAPIATSILNLSIKSQTVPCFWQFANISPFLRTPPPPPPAVILEPTSPYFCHWYYY